MVGPELRHGPSRGPASRGGAVQAGRALNAAICRPAHHGFAGIEGAVLHLERKRGTHEVVPEAFDREREVVVGQLCGGGHGPSCSPEHTADCGRWWAMPS